MTTSTGTTSAGTHHGRGKPSVASARPAGRIGRAAAALLVATLAVAGLAAVVPGAGAGASGTDNWVHQHPATPPPPRTYASMATTPNGGVMLFGGSSEGADLGTTWQWENRSWTEVATSGPSARTGAAIAYDATSHQDLLFGGETATGPTATTWSWNGSSWTKETPSTVPPARAYASMSYDPSLGGVVLFGGHGATGDLGTVWLWAGTTWFDLTPATATAVPGPRTTASLAYDTATGQLVLFGGYYGTKEQTTWVLSGTATWIWYEFISLPAPGWTKESPTTSPSARYGAPLAYDPSQSSLLLVGGSTPTPTSTTWAWTGTDWSLVTPATVPSPRAGTSAAYDTTDGQLVLADGTTSAPTWTWQPTAVLSRPGAPTTVTVERATQSVSVTWKAPSTTGGTAVSGYTVTSSPGTFTCTNSGATACTVTGLTNGTHYTFTVTATNGVGTSTPSSSSSEAVPAGDPMAPTDVGAVAGTLSATISWTAADANGTAVTDYTVTSGAKVVCLTTATTCVVRTLIDDVPYTFTVKATNGIGTGPTSTGSNTLRLAGPPLAPSDVTATRGNEAASVSWKPGSTNGSPISGFAVSSDPGTHHCTATAPTSSCTVSGLTNGTTYTFTVTATNGVSTSTPSIASTGVVPATAPFAPTGVSAQRGNDAARISWTAATANGTPVASYSVTSTQTTRTCQTTGTLACTIPGLTNGKTYTFTVTATNGVGTSKSSKHSNAVTPATVPSAPTLVVATAGDHQASVLWAASADNGTSVTGYTVTSSPTGKTCTTTIAHTCVVKGLTNGRTYTFTVVATNGVGTSLPSIASKGVIPSGTPLPPATVHATGAVNTAVVTWTAATTNGSAVTVYTVASSPAGGTCKTDGTTSCTVSGLVDGRSYTFEVKATNDDGTSTASSPSNAVVPAGDPYKTPNLSASAGATSVALSWAPSTDNGTALTGYRLLRGTAPGAYQLLAMVGGSTTTYTDTTAVPGTVYYYAVVSTNAVGDSVPSTAVSAEVDPPGDLGPRLAAMPGGQGYWIVHPTGGVTAYGRAQPHGSLPALGASVSNIVGIGSSADGGGYWEVSTSGGVFAFGDAPFYGSLPQMGVSVNDILGLVPTPDGRGYWLYGADGGVFSFGDANFFGSTGGMHLNKPVVGMAASPTGAGYWLVASDGGVFSFGAATFFGSTGSLTLNEPIVAMTPAHTGHGYWLVASDGGVFAFTVPFYGSTGGAAPPAPVAGMVTTPLDTGYSIIDATGTAFVFPLP